MSTTPKTKKPIEEVTSKVGLPISFAEFAKEPVKGFLFITILAIGYLYVDGRIDKNTTIDAQNKKIVVLETKVDTLTQQLIKVNAQMNEFKANYQVLKDLGK
jgi:hypothetical protein